MVVTGVSRPDGWQLERGHRELLLSRQVQCLAACNENCEVRTTTSKQVADYRCRFEQVLEVVQVQVHTAGT